MSSTMVVVAVALIVSVLVNVAFYVGNTLGYREGKAYERRRQERERDY